MPCLFMLTGQGGNIITAGKYNDGSHENRLLLTERLADGMKRAWQATKKEPATAAQIGWKVEAVALPKTEKNTLVANNSSELVWWQRRKEGKK